MKSLPSHLLTSMALLLTLFASTVQAVEILRWERLPLVIPLVVDQERVIFIDRNIRVGVPASVGDRLRVQSAGGALYLRANAPIEPTRLQLQDANDGTVILIDIVADPAQVNQTSLEPVRIIEAAATAAKPQNPQDENTPETGAATVPPRATPIPVVLTRYAAQHLYAPLRTVETVPGIARVNLRRDLELNTLLPTLPVHAQALAAWRLDNVWVSAVRLRNTSPRWVDLDPRTLQGKFVTATFQHPNLGPVGTPEDTTVVYLITHGHGLSQALLPALTSVDAATGIDQGGSHAQ